MKSAMFFTLKEAQKILKVSDPVLREFIRSGALEVVRVGPRTIRVPQSALAALGLRQNASP